MPDPRLNKYIATASQLSRRSADDAVAAGRVLVNGKPPQMGQRVAKHDVVTLDGTKITPTATKITILLNKPAGYVVSRSGQGSRTIFELLPKSLHNLQPVGRLDKQSSGLLLLTNDGELAQQLTHPSNRKIKQYEITLNKPLQPLHRQMVSEFGIQLQDGLSKLGLERLRDGDETMWIVTMHEGRNRQIRRTFDALGYDVPRLHRTVFGNHHLPKDLPAGSHITVDD